ncbi:MAG: PocR ligand-binding domain-containing protein [Deltaproteobacteria bacterium]|nr:PocR ligand-binding domain-containing protein [Deltaproteobacteria bacterium]
MSPLDRSGKQEADLNSLTMGNTIRLEDLVDRNMLHEVVRSFSALFGISMRIFSADGLLLTDCYEQQGLCKVINQIPDGRAACNTTVGEVKRVNPKPDGQEVHACFTGAHYQVASLSYDGRTIGKMVLGPYLPAELREVPAELATTVPSLDPAKAADLLPKFPRARAEIIRQIIDHMRSVLDLILFSGHKALLTSQMHLASVRESYRELQDKNARLQEAYDKLKELDKLKSNFIATVSHELRTPLTSIIGYSEMLSEGIAGDLAADQKEFVVTIREKGEQLLGLIMSLLDLSKLESGTSSLQKAELMVAEVLGDVVSNLKPVARKKSVDLVVGDVDPRATKIHADPTKLRQVLLNLADNALKFTPDEGKIVLSAAVVADENAADDEDGVGFSLLSPAKSYVEIRVADSGIGIPASERDKVFEAFYQVDSSSTREYGGTGLGLAIVKRLVEAHDGKVRIEDNTPCGTVVVVAIPVQASATP